MRFNETISGSILKESTSENDRTVIAGVLEGDFLSSNKRFYPEAIVRKASESLNGKPSMIGHDTNSPRDVVARIVDSRMSGKKLIASFKFGTDASSTEMFQKVKEGLIDSYSIRAWGESRPGKINGEDVDIVHELTIETVDLVVIPGVSSAKVLKVFGESVPEINYESKENVDMDVKELEAQLAESNRLLKEAQDAKLALEAEKSKLEEARTKAELDTKIATDLQTVREEYRTDIKESFSGSDKESWEKHFESQKKMIEKLCKKANVSESVVINPTDGKKGQKRYKNVNEALDSDELSKEDKSKVLVSVMGGKVK